MPKNQELIEARKIASLASDVADTIIKFNEQALEIALRYSQIDGAHHKAWVIDQMVRVLTGEGYDLFVAKACTGEDGPNTYSWDTGIAP